MDHVSPKRRIAKPLGLYIIAVFDFIVAGLVPFVATVLQVRNSELELPLFIVMVFIGLPTFIMATCVWVMIGDNAARHVLLALITLFGVVAIISHLFALASDEVFAPRSRSSGAIIRAAFWIGINWWYFNRAHVVAYFKQNR